MKNKRACSRQQRRNRGRGAVFIEALLALVAQTVVFGALLFLYQLGSEAHASLQVARRDAFDRAQNRCNQPVGGGAFTSPTAFDNMPQTADGAGTDTSILGPSQEETASSSSKSVSFAGQAFSASYAFRVPCNEGTEKSQEDAKKNLHLEEYMSSQAQ